MNPKSGVSSMLPRRGNLAVAADARQQRHSVFGALLIALLLMISLTVFLLDPLVAALRNERRVVAILAAAPGIVPGAPVWIAGHPVGAVSSVEFMPVQGVDSDPRIAVTLSIPDDDAALLRQDAEVRLTSDGIVGEPVIDIDPGSPAAPALTPQDTLVAALRPTGAELMAQAITLKAALDSLVTAAAPVSERASARLAELADVQEGFAGSQAELARLSDAIAGSAARDFMDDPTLARAIARLRSASASASAAAGDDAGAARVRAALAPLNAHARALSEQLAALRTGTANGTLTRLQSDSALAVAIRGVQAQLDSLIAEAKSNPLRFVF